MTGIMLFALIATVAIVLAALLGKNKSRKAIGFPYEKHATLFSAAERSFLGVLEQAVGPEHRVFGKVRVADIARVKSGLGKSARRGALNRIAAKHFDFVICRGSDLRVLCVVELDDKSHGTLRAQARDQLIKKVCEVIGLPLLQVPARATYSRQDIRSRFLASIAPTPSNDAIGP